MAKRSREDSDTLPSSSPISSSPVTSSSPVRDTDESPSKYAQLDEISVRHEQPKMISCSLPPHHRQALSFPTYNAYEIHYAKVHVNRCSACGKNFPTEHFLGLHIAENHDPLNEARKARGEKIYGCFVEDCDRKCSTPQKRRRHLIDKHMFPKDYDFYVVNNGIDRRNSMLRVRGQGHRRRSSAAFTANHREQRVRGYSLAKSSSTEIIQTATQADLPEGKSVPSRTTVGPRDVVKENDGGESEGSDIASSEEDVVDKDKPDGDMAKLTKSMSALKFVPPSIRLAAGRRDGRGGDVRI